MSRLSRETRANRDYFAAKLRAERQIVDVIRKVKEGKGDFVLVDARGREAFALGHIPGALCVPLPELDRLLPQLPRDRELVTYCWHDACQLSARMALELCERGFFAKEMNAGWKEWTEQKLPIRKGEAPAGRVCCKCTGTPKTAELRRVSPIRTPRTRAA